MWVCRAASAHTCPPASPLLLPSLSSGAGWPTPAATLGSTQQGWGHPDQVSHVPIPIPIPSCPQPPRFWSWGRVGQPTAGLRGQGLPAAGAALHWAGLSVTPCPAPVLAQGQAVSSLTARRGAGGVLSSPAPPAQFLCPIVPGSQAALLHGVGWLAPTAALPGGAWALWRPQALWRGGGGCGVQGVCCCSHISPGPEPLGWRSWCRHLPEQEAENSKRDSTPLLPTLGAGGGMAPDQLLPEAGQEPARGWGDRTGPGAFLVPGEAISGEQPRTGGVG